MPTGGQLELEQCKIASDIFDLISSIFTIKSNSNTLITVYKSEYYTTAIHY
jgi:hypothetical protein